MKILLLGGTGVIGSYLTRILTDKGHEIIVTSRTAREASGTVRYIRGNALEIGFLQEILRERHDVVVDFMFYGTLSFQNRICLLLDSTEHYVFLSTGRVYDKSIPPITEGSPRLLESSGDRTYLATDEYALAKARQENLLQRSGRVNWTIVRPYITYGEQRLQFGMFEKEVWLYRVLNRQAIIFPSEVFERTTTMTRGSDVAKGIAALIGKRTAFGETFQIVANGQKSKTWCELWKIYSEVLASHLGHRPRLLLRDTDVFMSEFPELNKYQIVYDRCFDRIFDSSKVSEYLSTDDFLRPEIGLTACLEKFLETPRFQGVDKRLMSKMDRLLEMSSVGKWLET